VKLDGKLPKDTAVAPLSENTSISIGSRVFVVGAPLGISHTLTVGVVSAKREMPSALGDKNGVRILQTDASINPGNSGGPMFDTKGEVVGVVSYIVSESGGSQGLGFAISADTVRTRLLSRSQIWTGVSYLPLAGNGAQLFHLPPGKAGLLVQKVAKDSISDKLGIRGGVVPARIGAHELLLGGDVILVVMGIEPTDALRVDQIRTRAASLKDGDTVEVVVLRNGEKKTLSKTWSQLK